MRPSPSRTAEALYNVATLYNAYRPITLGLGGPSVGSLHALVCKLNKKWVRIPTAKALYALTKSAIRSGPASRRRSTCGEVGGWVGGWVQSVIARNRRERACVGGG
jgi:hypothetical protein